MHLLNFVVTCKKNDINKKIKAIVKIMRYAKILLVIKNNGGIK